MSIIADYTNAIYDEQKFYAAYPPYAKLRLGDYGTLSGRIFTYGGNLADLPTPITVEPDNDDLDPVRYRDEFKVKQARAIKVGAGGKLDRVVTVKASLAVEFESGFGAYVGLAGATIRKIKNIKRVEDELCRRSDLDRDHRDRWDYGKLVLVNQIIEAKKAVVVMSGGHKSKIVLQAKGNVPKVDLADVNASFDLLYDDTSERQFYPEEGSPQNVTPFFWLMKVDRGFLGLGTPGLTTAVAGADDGPPFQLTTAGAGFDVEGLRR